MLECTGIGVSVTVISWHDADGIIALQEWGMLSLYHSEASKLHRKILPCDPHVLPCDSQVCPVTA